MKRPNRSGFTLLEVVIAMALFAMIAVPTVGLMTMSARKANSRMAVSNAEELKQKIENAIKGSGNVFTWDLSADSVTLYANQDLSKIAFSGDSSLPDASKYYRIEVKDPDGYTYSPAIPYRIFVYNIVWPVSVVTVGEGGGSDETDSLTAQQMVLTSVFRNK